MKIKIGAITCTWTKQHKEWQLEAMSCGDPEPVVPRQHSHSPGSFWNDGLVAARCKVYLLLKSRINVSHLRYVHIRTKVNIAPVQSKLQILLYNLSTFPNNPNKIPHLFLALVSSHFFYAILSTATLADFTNAIWLRTAHRSSQWVNQDWECSERTHHHTATSAIATGT